MNRVWTQKGVRHECKRAGEYRSFKEHSSHGRVYEARLPTVEIHQVVECDLELVIDVDAILRSLGRSAALNKGGKASGLGGLVTVRARNRRVVEEDRKPIEHGPEYVLVEEAKQ